MFNGVNTSAIPRSSSTFMSNGSTLLALKICYMLDEKQSNGQFTFKQLADIDSIMTLTTHSDFTVSRVLSRP
jgi:hypothetical protein